MVYFTLIFGGSVTSDSTITIAGITFEVTNGGQTLTCLNTDPYVIPVDFMAIGLQSMRDSLISIDTGTAVTSIGNWAFYLCGSVTSITIGSGVTIIYDNAFNRCTGATSLTIGSGVTSIGNGAFQVCESLTNIVIPDNVTFINEYAFAGCIGATSLTIGSGLTSIGTGVFITCSGATSLTIGSGVTSIGISAFSDCNNLLSVIIPDNVTSIGNYAFDSCYAVNNVYFQGTQLPTAEVSSFNGCNNQFVYYLADAVPPYTDASVTDYFTRIMPWATPIIVSNPPNTPTGITATSTDTTIEISWDNDPIATYWTVVDTAHNINITTETNFATINGLPPNTHYSLTITAYNNYGASDGAIVDISTACFLAGSVVFTDQGDINIEDLVPNKHTINGLQIKKVSKSISPEKFLVCFEKDCFADNVPNKTTYSSLKHLITYESETMTAYIWSVNQSKKQKREDKRNIKKTIYKVPYNGEMLYNVVLSNYITNMKVNNMEVETLNNTHSLAL